MTIASNNGAVPTAPWWGRLEDQLAWYERSSARCKRAFHQLKLVEIVVAAAIPASVALGASAAVAGSLGAVIVVLEGAQQLFQFQQNWTGYRATAEALKHERFLFLAQAGPYRDAPDRERLLAERVEAQVSTEHAAWVNEQHETTRRSGLAR
jgi:low affinity Fe/Cu permease